MTDKNQTKRLKALFLYNGERSQAYQRVLDGSGHSAGFWGMVHLPQFGINARFIEFEQYVPVGLARFLRQYIFRNIYFVHVLFYPLFFSYDIIFTSSAFGTQLLHTLLRVRKPVWVMHDFSISSLVGNSSTLKQKVFRYLVRRSAGVVTIGREETEKLQVLFPEMAERITFIPFGVDLSFFKRQDVKLDGTILAVGFDPDRDWRTLIEAARGTDLRVVIATRPSRLQGIDLPPNVTHRTFTQEELINAYARASVIAIPMDTSKGVNDAMGCSTLFEAMAMGKVIVATNTHTFASYIEDGVQGLLVPERDIVGLRTALERVISDTSLAISLGENAYEYAKEHLDVVMLTKQLADFFKRVIRPSSGVQ